MEQLLALDRPGMHKLWDSVWGDRLYHWLRGVDVGDDGAPVASDIQKSLGHSHVLGPEFRTIEGAWAVAHKLLHKAAMRLRMEKFHAASLSFNIKFSALPRADRRSRARGQNPPPHQRHRACFLGHGGALPALPGHAKPA